MNRKSFLLLVLMAAIVFLLSHAKAAAGSVRIGVSGDKFTLNGTPTFLLGASYFDAYGWNPSDLDALQARKFNLIRIFLDYLPESWDSSFAPRSRSFFNPDGSMKNTQFLLDLIRAADSRGMAVDVTILMSGSNPASAATAVANAVTLLKNEPNVFFDLVNEHADDTDPSLRWSHDHFPTIQNLFKAARAASPNGIYTVSSSSGDNHILLANETVNATNINQELQLGVQVLTPHFSRAPNWYDLTETRVQTVKNYLASQGKNIPLYLQEEARRDSTWIMPTKDHFLQAANEAFIAGAAGWIFHTEAGFDMRTSTWFQNLNSVETAVVNELAAQLMTASPPRPTPEEAELGVSLEE
jgi:Cellulase (glycosyl hydrolase family 5)